MRGPQARLRQGRVEAAFPPTDRLPGPGYPRTGAFDAVATQVRATRLGVLSGLVWLGWNKVLDIVDHPNEDVREREKAALPWWLDRAREALDTGL